jgi:hypothetical protein
MLLKSESNEIDPVSFFSSTRIRDDKMLLICVYSAGEGEVRRKVRVEAYLVRADRLRAS